MKRIAFIINGKLKSIEKIQTKITDIFNSEFDISFYVTKKSGHATELAKNAVDEKYDYIIGVCGDGTLNEIVNGIMNSTGENRKNVIAGILPNGTGNDFARTLKVKHDLTQLLYLIKNNKYKAIDVGLVDYTAFDGNKAQRYFNNITEIGVGSQSVKYVNISNKWMGSNLTFFKSIIKSFLRYKHQEIILTSGDFSFKGKIVNVCIANGIFFGSGLGISPDSVLNDGLFNLVIVGNVRIIDFLRYLPKLKKKTRIIHKEVKYLTTTQCTIEIAGEPYPFDIDGEYVGNTPFSVTLLPSQINFLQNDEHVI